MPRTLRVESTNQWFQRAEVLLRNRRRRRQHGQFVVEGVRSINELVARPDWSIEAFLHARDRELSGWARGVLADSRAAHHLILAPDLMEALSERDDPSELLAIVRLPAEEVARIPVREDALIVVADRTQSPGNLGTLIRSCDALGAHGLVLIGHTADPYDPRSVRAAAGSLFALPVARVESLAALQEWLGALRSRLPALSLLGTSASAESELASADLRGPTLLMVGGEARGLSEKLRALCDTMVTIPMQGSASSLNIASALTVMLYEASVQRRGER